MNATIPPRSIKRACDGCCPVPVTLERVSWKDDHAVYECNNCGWRYTRKFREVKAGGPKQTRIATRIKELAATANRPVVETTAHGSDVAFRIESLAWYEETLYVRIGAKGALEVTYYPTLSNAAAVVSTNRAAWAVLEIRLKRV